MRDSLLYAGNTNRMVRSNDWLGEIQAGGYLAVIFDCDGTLVDSTDAHFLSIQSALHAQGHDLTRDWYRRRTGMDRYSMLRAFAEQTDIPLNIDGAARQSIKRFMANSDAVTPIAETTDLVRTLFNDYPMAVGTNAEVEVARASLTSTDLLRYFECISCVSDGLAPKPSPDIFQLATERLGYSITQTLVFEDSDEGVQAALSAGLDVVKLT